MTERTGAQLLVECLLAQEIEMGFGVPGESYLAVLDALHDVSNQFKFIGTRNEGGASFMAEAYGKLTGKPGICFVTRGPGATNASIGIHTAMQDSSPMIVFVGQVARSMKDREAFQELDYKAVFGTMAKWVVEIDDADRVPELVCRAFSVALSGRPGPVVVALPEDMLTDMTSALPRGKVHPALAAPHSGDVTKAMEMLAAAEKPLLITGGGSGGWNNAGQVALQKFAEANALPVAVTFRNQDLIDNDSPSYVGDAAIGKSAYTKTLIEESDLLLAVNIRFGETMTDGYELLDPATFDKKLIHIHPGEAEIGKVFTPDIGINASPNLAMTALAEQPPVTNPAWKARTEAAHEAWKKSLDVPPQPGAVDMGEVSKYLRNNLPDDAIIANGAGNFAIWPGKHLHYTKAMRMLSPQAGAMGAGVPAAVMAKLVDPTRFVLCFAGDGDFQMNCQELGTALQHGAAPVILVLNNGMYGTIRMHQEREYPERVSGTAIVNPDFAVLAQAYGMHGERVEKTEDFEAAYKRACDSRTGGVIELVIDPEAIGPRMTISSLRAAAV